ncbi:MAG: HutP family protein [Clostridia bacterium]|nr:HutP family protein [Clostridia bacterium]
MEYDSRDIAKVAITMAMTDDRAEEAKAKEEAAARGIRAAAVDFGGEFIPSMSKLVERAVVAAKREGIINSSHLEEGAVAGAAREALTQIMPKALGLNVGGKIGLARCEEHMAVSVFFGIGLLHLNEISVGLGHRAL